MSSIRLQEYAGEHAPMRWMRRFPWVSRYWQGAWVTQSGWIIRSWLDEVLMEQVRDARSALPKRA